MIKCRDCGLSFYPQQYAKMVERYRPKKTGEILFFLVLFCGGGAFINWLIWLIFDSEMFGIFAVIFVSFFAIALSVFLIWSKSQVKAKSTKTLQSGKKKK